VSLLKRGNVYWTYIWIDGVRHARSTGTNNRRQAETIEQRYREELNLRRHNVAVTDPRLTFGELAAQFLANGATKPWHVDRLKVLLPYFADIPVRSIGKAAARDYRAYRHRQRTLTETTVNRDLEALRHILYWGVDEELLLSNPLARLPLVRERRKRRPVLPLEDEQKLLAECAPHLRRIVIAALDTGMRRGEILAQRWEDIDFARELLWATHSKTPEGEAREIPFTKRLFQMLWESREDEGLIFTFKNQPVHRVKTAWKAAIRRAGIRPLRFHDLRHTFNTRLMEAGVMQEVRKALMGHSSGEDVHSMYTHVELPMKRDSIRKLEAWLAQHNARTTSKSSSPDQTKGGP